MAGIRLPIAGEVEGGAPGAGVVLVADVAVLIAQLNVAVGHNPRRRVDLAHADIAAVDRPADSLRVAGRHRHVGRHQRSADVDEVLVVSAAASLAFCPVVAVVPPQFGQRQY